MTTKNAKKKDFWGVFKSAHFQVPESGTLSARIQKLKHPFTPTSPQNGGIGVNRTFSTKWWPGEANAQKIIFVAFLVFIHIDTTYIK